MPTVLNLQQLSGQRLDEADDLLRINRVDAAFYLAGYAIEMALKAAICRTLDQPNFYKPCRPLKGSRLVQDKVFREFKTHNYPTADAMNEDMDERLGLHLVVSNW